MKRAIGAVFLCAILVLCTLAGCSSPTTSLDNAGIGDNSGTESTETPSAPSNQGDMVTLSLYIPTLATYSNEAVSKVEAAMNEHLAENYGIQVKLQYIEFGNFENSINLAMTTDELDVTCYFPANGALINYVTNGQLLDITEYFNNASEEFKNTFTDAEIGASSVNGRMYGVVRKYQYGGKEVAVMNADIVAELGIDPASITDMDSLGEVLYQVHEAYPDIYTLVPQSTSEMTWCKPWVEFIGSASFAYAEDVESTELKSIFELDSFAEFCSYTNRWYEDGLIMADAISNTIEGSSLVTAGTAFACLHNCDTVPLDTMYPNTVVSADLISPFVSPSDIGNLQYGISTNSAHPDEAFTLLEAIYTDAELIALLCYGIEGEHYVINEDGRADYPEGMTAENEPYGGIVATAVYPNYLLLPVKASDPIDNYKLTVDEWNDSVATSATAGFYFDTTEHTDFITAYNNLKDKYYDALMTGSVALEDVLPTIQQELTSIGFYELLEQVQTELDAWLAQ